MNEQLKKAASEYAEGMYTGLQCTANEKPDVIGVLRKTFEYGAEWQEKKQASGRDIDPVPAWFGLVPVEVNTNN